MISNGCYDVDHVTIEADTAGNLLTILEGVLEPFVDGTKTSITGGAEDGDGFTHLELTVDRRPTAASLTLKKCLDQVVYDLFLHRGIVLTYLIRG